MKDYIIQTTALSKQFGKSKAVNKVNMHVKQGEIYGLVGKNGAGKTTIMKMICGIIAPSEGQIEILDNHYDKVVEKIGERIGNMLETPAFFPYFTAHQNLEYYRLQKGVADSNKVEELLKFVGLEGVGKKKFKGFSLGMKQRLGLAYALLGDPDILVLDEPTNGLDPQGIIDFRNTILKMVREKQITVIISSHILSELSMLADTYGFIKDGHLLEEISASVIEERSKHYLLLKVNDTNKAAVILENELQTTMFEVIEGNCIKVFEHVDEAAKVNKALVLGGVEVSGLEEIKGNLETYYMHVMGGEKNA